MSDKYLRAFFTLPLNGKSYQNLLYVILKEYMEKNCKNIFRSYETTSNIANKPAD